MRHWIACILLCIYPSKITGFGGSFFHNVTALDHVKITKIPRSMSALGTNYGRAWSQSRSSGDPIESERSLIAAYQPQTLDEAQHSAIPRFLYHPPPIMYASKGQPAVIRCVAQPVVLLYTVCVINTSGADPTDSERHQVESSSSLSNGTLDQLVPDAAFNDSVRLETTRLPNNPSDDTRHMLQRDSRRWQVTRYVNARMVKEWFGDFWCHCEAWNNVLEFGEPRVVVTPRTYVHLAYLDKRFLRQPTSARILLGWKAEFVCDAPEGRPTPQIYWYKNSKLVNVSREQGQITIVDSSGAPTDSTAAPLESDDFAMLAVSSALDLSAEPATTNDSLKHSRSVAETASTSTSRLIIHTTKLSDEGLYTCVAENMAGRRTSNPARLTIHADGRWSKWSAWTPCPTECSGINESNRTVYAGNRSRDTLDVLCPVTCHAQITTRHRACNAPEPHGGGRQCPGEEMEEISCFDYCHSILTNSSLRNTTSRPEFARPTATEISLLIVLVFAILVFLVAAFSVIYLFARKWWCAGLFPLSPEKPIDSTRVATTATSLPELIELSAEYSAASRKPHCRQGRRQSASMSSSSTVNPASLFDRASVLEYPKISNPEPHHETRSMLERTLPQPNPYPRTSSVPKPMFVRADHQHIVPCESLMFHSTSVSPAISAATTARFPYLPVMFSPLELTTRTSVALIRHPTDANFVSPSVTLSVSPRQAPFVGSQSSRDLFHWTDSTHMNSTPAPPQTAADCFNLPISEVINVIPPIQQQSSTPSITCSRRPVSMVMGTAHRRLLNQSTTHPLPNR